MPVVVASGSKCHDPVMPRRSKRRSKRRSRRRTKRRIWWSRLSDEKLLQMRLKDLHVKVEGTWLDRCVRQLHEELEERGIRFMPHVWISDEWFSPSDTPASPFRFIWRTRG